MPTKVKPTPFAFYCTCGDAMTGSAQPADKILKVKWAWDQVHTGEGHAPCDRKTAANERRRLVRVEAQS